MMLRGSSEEAGEDVTLDTIVDGAAVDSGLPGSAELVRFTDAVLTEPDDLPAAREALAARLGEAALVDAAGVVGNFQRMVRIADSTGIPVDGRMAAASEDVRAQLGLEQLASTRLVMD